ncbi:MAG: hypothetical protein AVDCRST_MAG67-3372, partial [uncultured Solirubrobacteraceae bacterium]
CGGATPTPRRTGAGSPKQVSRCCGRSSSQRATADIACSGPGEPFPGG